MATDATGNVLKVPGYSGPGTPTTDDEILASYAALTQKGLTLEKKTSGAGSLLLTGTVLVVSNTAKKYKGALKSEVANAVGILRKDVDLTTEDKLANVVLAGRVKGSKVKYIDDNTTANSDTNPAGYLTIAELNSLATTLAGRYDVVHDMLIF